MQTTAHNSYWRETADQQNHVWYPALDHDLETDVVIIGAGITGLTAARHLKAAGQRVVVLEGTDVGAGTSGFTTAQLDMTTDQPLQQLIDDFGERVALALVDASRDAIDEIEARCNLYGNCNFVRLPSYAYSENTHEPLWIKQQYEAAKKLRIPLSLTNVVPLPFCCPHALRTERQGRFHSQRYLQKLAAEVHGEGCSVYEQTRAQPPEPGHPCVVQTSGGTIRARDVFAATHSAFLNISQWDLRVSPYQSYVLGVRVEDDVPDALFWDDAQPYHYIRRAASGDPHLLLIGGADHKTGQGDDEQSGFKQLEEYVSERFAVKAIEYRWSAEFFDSVDGIPYVGLAPRWEHVYVATGYSGTGMTLGTVAGNLVADLILQRPNPLAKALDPGRVTIRASAASFIAENVNVAYRFVVDRFRGEEIASADELPLGTGQIVMLDGKQRAVFRDPTGRAHILSPFCTHAGCIVQWNEAERTWDCPCHGGRYTAEGKCFYGPPRSDLKREEP